MTRGAGGGRPAKPAGQARNQNKPMRGSIVLSASARVDKVPAPPLPLDGVRLEIWDQMWAQPIATLWSVVDLTALCRLVILQTTLAAYSKAELLREMRCLEDRFLLNPYSRAQQRVVIDGEAEGAADGSNVAWYADAKARLRSTS